MHSEFSNHFSCRAILFDMDGTLIDSTGWVERQWTRWAGQNNVDLEVLLRVCHGRRTLEIMELVAPHLASQAAVDRLLGEAEHDVQGIVAIAGAGQLLASLEPPAWAVVTSATRRIAQHCMTSAGLPLPRVMVSADDVQRGKPRPDPYLKAAELVGVPPENCLVLEDAPVGIEAARAAGMQVIGVTSTFPAAVLGCEVCVPDLSEIHAEVDGALYLRITAGGSR